MSNEKNIQLVVVFDYIFLSYNHIINLFKSPFAHFYMKCHLNKSVMTFDLQTL